MLLRLHGVKLRGGGRPDEWAALDRAAASLAGRFGPASSEPAEVRADLFKWQGRPDKAVAVLRQEVARRPGNSTLWARLIDETADLYGTAAGFQTLDEALAVAGDGPDFRIARATLAAKDPARLRPIEPADVSLDTWAEADRTQYLYGLVEVYDRLGDRKNLARVYGLIAKQRPADPAAWFAAYQAGDPTAAAKILALEGEKGPTVALVNAVEAMKAGTGLNPARDAVVAAFGTSPYSVDACLALARFKRVEKETEGATTLFERAIKLDPTGVAPAGEYLTFLAATGAETRLTAFLARLHGDPRWVGDPVRRVVTTACLKMKPDDVKRLLAATEKPAGADPKAAAWLGDAYVAAGMKAEAVKCYEAAASSSSVSPDDYLRLALVTILSGTKEPMPLDGKAKLSGASYWAYLAAFHAVPGNGNVGPLTLSPAEYLAFTQARLALALTQDRRTDAIGILDQAIRSKEFPKDNLGWAKRTLGMLLADRGTPAERRRAFELLVNDPTTGGTTPDDKRVSSAVLASLARYLDGPDRAAALAKAAALLADVAAATSSPRDKFLRFQVLRAAGDPASRNEARAILNGLIDPKAPNLDYLIAGLTEVAGGTSEVERKLAESFAAQLQAAFPGEFRAVAAVARHECSVGRIETALTLVDGYVRAEAGPADAQARSARAADLLDGIARMPAPAVTSPPVIVPVAGVGDPGSTPGVNDPGHNPRRKLIESAVAKYEGLILARPEAAAAAAALLAFDGRPADALALVEKHPALATRLKAAAGVAVLRAGPTSDAQAAKVKAWLDAALAEEPDSIAVKLTQAEYLAHRQDYAAAEKVYDAVLTADPANVVALNNLAWLLAPSPAQAAKALDLVERAAAHSGLTAELLDTRARVRIAARQPALAEQDALQALAREPTPLRYFHLAMAKRAARPPKADEARDAFKAAKARGLAAYMVHPADLAALRTFDTGD
jgi:Tfp pilus assembly protein PilF